MALLDFVTELVAANLEPGPHRVGLLLGVLGFVGSIRVVRRQRSDRPVASGVAIAALLLLVLLLPIGGLWIEHAGWGRSAGLEEDQLGGVWGWVKQRAWGEHPIGVALAAAPAALVLLAGSRVRPGAWRPWRVAWALVVTMMCLGVAIPVAWSGELGLFVVLPLAVLLVVARGAWLLTRDGATEADRVTQRTVAATFVLWMALVVAAVVSSGHIRATHCGWPISQVEWAEREAARAAAHDHTWRVGLAVAMVASAPLLAMLRGRRPLLLVTTAAVATILALAHPAWVRARAMPEWRPVVVPSTGPRIEIVEPADP